jgi:23S rRNA pseudouridine1911/1915/1917 synthase
MNDVEINEDMAGERLDVFTVQFMPDLSRAFVQKLCERGEVLINDKPSKPSYKLRVGDKLSILYKPDAKEQIPDIDLPILYEDDDCIVLNKPIGVLTHSKGAFNPEATVATFLQDRVAGLEGERAGIVHRLDRATSGVIIAAKNPPALSWLQKQFSQRKAKKIYIAIVPGHLPNEHAIIDMPIERNPKKPQTFRVGAQGKNALTEYLVVESNDEYSMLQLAPQTGRTHQLRVHLAHLGHPIVGDTLYGGKTAERLFLHALSLEITLPNKERKTFTASLPDVFERTMKT